MTLSAHERIARYLFWFAQAIGVLTVLGLLIFIGGSLIDEMLNQVINFKEDYTVFLLFFFEVLIAVAIIISWSRKRMGPVFMIALAALISIWWGLEGLTFLLIHLPLLFSGILLLFYSYYKEWILKQKA